MDYELLLRIIIAGLLGALIGLEREKRFKEAGLRTHFLVAVGSAIIMIISKYAFDDIVDGSEVILDPSRVAAQVVSGIGFLGAGMIIVHRSSIHGLTTAAGIWTTAGIGLAIGAGLYEIGIFGGLLVIVGLEFLKRIFSPIIPNRYKLTVEMLDNKAIQAIIDELTRQKIIIKDYQVKIKSSKEETMYQVHLKLQTKGKWKENEIILMLQQYPSVTKIKL